jgi:hypothetical protein
LPAPWRDLEAAAPYPVTVSPALSELAAAVDTRLAAADALAS